MNTSLVDKIVNAVLYEGYLLYPYRRCVKNEKRMMFGCVYPRDYCQRQAPAEAFRMQTQCLLEVENDPELEVQVRFLQFVTGREADFLEAVERKIEMGPLAIAELRQ